MKIVKVKTRTPDGIRKMVLAALMGNDLKNATNFNMMVQQSVNLQAKNTKNFASKDLAMLQVCDLAKMYGVTVELI